MNATAVGSIAVLVWGASLPINRLIEEQIGVPATVGMLFLVSGLLALSHTRLREVNRAALRHPALYGRWLCFVVHEAFILSAVGIVSREHLPFVVLLNYLWPTAIILCSMAIAGVHVTRRWAFAAGTVIVLFSLSQEILGKDGLRGDLFAAPLDCLSYALAAIGAVSWGMYCARSAGVGDTSPGRVRRCRSFN